LNSHNITDIIVLKFESWKRKIQKLGKKYMSTRAARKRSHTSSNSTGSSFTSPPNKRAAGASDCCVIGIDFGTARTGYGYAFPSQGIDVVVKEPGGQEAKKTLTNVLLAPDGTFKAFGTKARDDFYESDCSDLFFEKFKMQLHDSSTRGGTPMATACSGVKKPLMDVIAHTLRYVKDQAMETINRNQPVAIRASDCRWVVTVPAIWKDAAKAYMREAAYKAGLVSAQESTKLQLVLEPEAACVACEADSRHLKEGDSFMVLDCGGGTVDITLHSVKQVAPLAVDEIAPPSGGPWGSTYVDKQFEEFICSLIGSNKMEIFKKTTFFVELMDNWESVKLAFDPVDGDNSRPKTMNLSPLLEVVDVNIKDLVEDFNCRHAPNEFVCPISTTSLMTDPVIAADGHTYERSNIEEWFRTHNTSPKTNRRLTNKTLTPNHTLGAMIKEYANKCVRVRGRSTVLMPCSLIKEFFEKVVSSIIHHVEDIVCQHQQLQYIYLAGGFAESPLLRARVQQEFERAGRKVIVPSRPGIAVILGAVRLGLMGIVEPGRQIFASRRARFTYGIAVRFEYDHALDKGRRTFIDPHGKTRVSGGFAALVKAGAAIQCGETFREDNLTAGFEGQTRIALNIYASTSSDARYIDVPGTSLIGSFSVPCSERLKESVNFEMTFGAAEIGAVATNAETGEVKEMKLQFNFNGI
jgi:hypothetical protein